MANSLQAVWDEFESFRDAFRVTVSWGPDRLSGITQDDLESQDLVPDRLTKVGPQPAAVLSVLRFLGEAVEDYESVDALVSDARTLAERDPEVDVGEFDAASPVIRGLMPARAEAARQRARHRAETSIAPVLVNATGSVDLRTAPREGSDEVRFVPLVQLRLTFDEPVVGGSDAAVFQVPLRSLSLLEGELSRLRDELQAISEAVGDRLL